MRLTPTCLRDTGTCWEPPAPGRTGARRAEGGDAQTRVVCRRGRGAGAGRTSAALLVRRCCALVLSGVLSAGTEVLLTASADAAGPRFSAQVYSRGEADHMVGADVNGDGITDLVTLGGLSDDLSVRLGVGDGSLRPPVTHPGPIASDLDAADVNGDTSPDLLVTTSERRGSVLVMLNDGAGRFRRAGRYTVADPVGGAAVRGAAAVDVNHDGSVDMLVTHFDPTDLSVLLGTGTGSFAAPVQYEGDGAHDVAAGDLNGDGALDVALPSVAGKRLVAVRLGDGRGGFGPERGVGRRSRGRPSVGIAAGEASTVKLADLNRDGVLDLLVPQDQPYFTRIMAVFLGRGDGTFGAASKYVMNTQTDDTAVADFDGDGIVDVATVGRFSRIALRSGRGDGTLGPAAFFAAGRYGPLIVADFNRDGRPDLAATGLYGVSLYLNWTGLPAPPCAVPGLVRKRHRAARRAIARAGCRVGRTGRRYSRDIPSNRVIAQDPPRGSVLPSHGRVDLAISRGPRR
jgi:hypothetical protein